jgi:hypothetical protein
MQAYYNAIAQQDAQNALNAQQYGQQQLTFGQGLLSGAYAPYQTALGTASNIEDLGMNALTVGSQLGAKTAAAGAQVGNTLLKGGLGAAETMQKANSQSPFGSTISGLAQNTNFTNALGNWGSNMWNYGGTPQGAYGQQAAYMQQIPTMNTQQAQMLNEQNSWF